MRLAWRCGREAGELTGVACVAAALRYPLAGGFAALLCLTLAHVPASAQMFLPGTLEASDTGAAVYTMPIVVPPGTAGMQPSLSLQYNSQAGNGMMGMGWSLTGLPTVTRCPQTVAQDGVAGAINYDANDRFCLEGERLIAINGTYGQDQTEYRTERDGFSRIVGYGNAAASGAWFRVYTKSGQVMDLGRTDISPNSAIMAPGRSAVRIWALSWIQDRIGEDNLTVTYTSDAASGVMYPQEIDYTGNRTNNLQPYASVQFTYETRPDPISVYQAGSLLQTTQRLIRIRTYIGSNIVRNYILSYQQGGDVPVSELTSVALQLSDGSVLPATTFAWQGGVSNFSQASNLPEQGITGAFQQWTPAVFGDFNGDGKTDILWIDADQYGRATGAPNYQVWLSNGDGSFLQNGNLPEANIPTAFQQWTPLAGDFNGDGKTDILWIDADTYGRSVGAQQIWLSNGDGTFTQDANFPEATVSGAFAGWRPYVADFNGDGRADVLWVDADQYGRATGAPNYQVWLSTGSGFTQNANLPEAGITGAFQQWMPAAFGDFNGDGKTDILWIDADTSGRSVGAQQIWLSNGDGTFTQDGNLPEAGVSGAFAGWRPYAADFNGDGITDVLWVDADPYGRATGAPNYQVWMGTGLGFTQNTNLPEAGITGAFQQWIPAAFGDFNGDGKTDILWVDADQYGRSVGAQQIWLSNGDATFAQNANFPESTVAGAFAQWRPITGDFNGDGKSDVLWIGADVYGRSLGAPDQQVWLSDGKGPNRVVSLTTGLGATSGLTYAPLTSGSPLYVKDTGASACSYPCVDIAAPMWVTSQVATSNGAGGTYVSSYAYAGAKADLSGRGFLGFRQMTATDVQTRIVTTTGYQQSFPFTGLIATRTKTLGSQTLNSTTNAYVCVNETANDASCAGQPPGTRYFVSLQQSTEQSYDLNGTALPAVTTNSQYDGYGNATQVTVATSDGYSKTTNSTYTNDTTDWFLGRLTSATVSSSTPQ